MTLRITPDKIRKPFHLYNTGCLDYISLLIFYDQISFNDSCERFLLIWVAPEDGRLRLKHVRLHTFESILVFILWIGVCSTKPFKWITLVGKHCDVEIFDSAYEK
jgi:hypothetical protein